MAKPTLTEQDFQRAAKKLRCEVPAIKAVAEVESRGKGFYASGFPVILFERHIFRKYTQGRYNSSHPHLSGPAGNYGAAGQHQINKFNEAFGLNPTAAMKACSWGKFQIMGFNHEVCGYEDVGSFVDAMKESEGKQLDAFVEFVIGNGLGIYLRTKNWASFAKRYNGAGYRKNNYDTKMASAYKRHSGVSTPAAVQTATDNTSPSEEPQNSEPPTNIETEVTQNADTIINEESLVDKTSKLGDKFQSFQGVLDKFGFSIDDAKRSLGTVLLTWFKAIGSAAMVVGGVLLNHWELLVIAVLLAVLAYLLWDRSGKRVAEAKAGMPVEVAKEMIKQDK